ncbi:cache domain-containing protein [Paraburkholderia polaris]|nr:cache domain-containing protein [Paraburkholderia polaris]
MQAAGDVCRALPNSSAMLSERNAAVQSVVECAYGIVADYAKLVDRHELTLDQAKQQAMARLSVMRYPGNGYMIITTATPVVIMHPTLADLRNKDVVNVFRLEGAVV